MFYIILLLCYFAKRMSKLMHCFYIIGLRGIKVNFMRHLALLGVVSRCPPLLFGAALSGLAISVTPFTCATVAQLLHDVNVDTLLGS